MNKKIILVGNPNSGKTTLLNTLTKGNEKTSNWHGVTVGVKIKKCHLLKNFDVVDLPGIYSLKGFSNEEKIATDFLSKNKNELIVNICDEINLRRNLILTRQLIEHGFNVIIVINKFLKHNNIDTTKIEKFYHVPAILIDVRKHDECVKLCDLIQVYLNKKPQKIFNAVKIMAYNEDKMQNNCEKYSKTPLKLIDNILFNKYFAIPLFLIVILTVFYITFGTFGSIFSGFIDTILSFIYAYLRKTILCLNIADVIKIMLIDGVLSSVFSVLNFVPQILLLLFLMNILEESGYMSRVSFLFDGLMKKIGLSGKSLFSLMLGFGCTSSAVLTTRNLQTTQERKRTILMLPFFNCSAKLPVMLTVVSLFFEKYKYFYVFGFYILGVFVSTVSLLIYNKISKTKEENLILEMPRLRLPSLKKILKDSLWTLKDFCLKIGTTILFFGVLVWFVKNFDFRLNFLNGSNFKSSILYKISNTFSPLFFPLGLNNAGIVSALFFGLVAKELVLVSLALINGVSISKLSISLLSADSVCFFTLESSLIFLIFIMLYSPCISALSTIKNEMGNRFACFVFVFQTFVAYLVAFIFKLLLFSNIFTTIICFVIILDIMFVSMLKFIRNKKHCRGNCNECRKI